MTDMNDNRLRALEIQSAEILTLLRSLSDKVDDRTDLSNAWRSRVDKILIGDGNGSKGHNVRLDRLEQAQERHKWMGRALLVPVFLLALQAVASLL